MEYRLSEQKPIVVGGEKLVYQHPDSPDLLIKVWQQKNQESLLKKHPFISKYMRLPKYSAFRNEIIEHLAIREQEKDTHFAQTITGIVDTDMGLGLVVEAIHRKDGNLALTLRQLVEAGQFEEKHEQELQRLFDWMTHTYVIIRDFNSLNNMLWDEFNSHFVIIDGIGSKPTISIRSFSRSYNQRSNKKKIRKLKVCLERLLQQQAT